MIAERNFVTEDRSMLSFHKCDIIRLQVMDGLDIGEIVWRVWQQSCYSVNLGLMRVCVYPPGYSYGCVVKKKVVFLEELKRDTPDFGESSFIHIFIF